MGAYAGCGEQCVRQLGGGEVAILRDDFGKECAMWVELALALGTPARTRHRTTRSADHRAPIAGESFKRNAAARPLKPSSI